MSYGKEKNNGQTLWLDLTYSFQDHPILISPDKNGFTPPYHCGSCASCGFKPNCTQIYSVAWANITVEQVKKHFPEELLFKSVQGHHTGQGNIEFDDNYFTEYDFNHNMLAWGVNERAAFRIRYEGDIVAWMGFELQWLEEEDIPVILDLCSYAVKCTPYPLYLCTKGKNAVLIPLSDSEGILSALNRAYGL